MRRIVNRGVASAVASPFTASFLVAGGGAHNKTSSESHLFIIHSLDGSMPSRSAARLAVLQQQRRYQSSGTPPTDPTKATDAAAKSEDAAAVTPSAATDATAAADAAPAATPTTSTASTTGSPATPSETPAAAASNNSSKKKPLTPINISGNAPPPKGFERYFQREILAQLPSANRSPAENAKDQKANERAMESSSEEIKILDTQQNLVIYNQRLMKVTVLVVLLGLLISFKSYRAWSLMSQAPDIDALKRVKMSKGGHVATFYDEDAKPRAMQYFIDARTFHEEMTSRDKEVLVGVPSYFPVIPMMLLCLLPLMAMMSGAFNASARMAAKAGRSAAAGGGSAGGGSSGGMPGGADSAAGRFKFKKEIDIPTRLDDVAGLTEAKHEVTEVIDFLKNPQRYRELGASLPKGVLLDGPPGVGKTLLAKAVAGEAMVNFVSCSGSEFEEVYVGVGAQRVRELFKQARASRPCVVFIDEIDAFGRKRQSDRGGNSRSTLNAFLSELDGFHDASGIIVLAATNRADVLDSALTRSGRFDRKISIDKPPHKDRVAIAKVHLKPLKLDPAVTLEGFAETLASLTPGCSGADIYNICNEAAIIASREDRDFVNLQCFHKAIDRVLVGMEKRATKLTAHEKARLAYHEAGHAVLNWFLPLPDPVTKVSIAPRGTQIGITQKLPHEVFIKTQDRLRQAMVAKLGGFVSEEYFFSDLSSSAADDLQRVTDDARAEICIYGMDPDVGNFGYEMNDQEAIQKPFGPKKEDQIDVAVARVVESCADKARALLREHIQHVHSVAGSLMKQETLTAQELYVLLGERPEMSEEFRKYLES